MWSDPSSRSSIPVATWIGAFDPRDRGLKGRGDAPQVGRLLLAAGEHRAAVGAERHEPDLVLVLEGRPDRLARDLVPELRAVRS